LGWNKTFLLFCCNQVLFFPSEGYQKERCHQRVTFCSSFQTIFAPSIDALSVQMEGLSQIHPPMNGELIRCSQMPASVCVFRPGSLVAEIVRLLRYMALFF
jgi:hypothetical protein